MVLVSYRLDNYISTLQTKLSAREGHEARRGGLEAMPLDQHIEGGHGERQARLKIRPAPMHHLFAMADERQCHLTHKSATWAKICVKRAKWQRYASNSC